MLFSKTLSGEELGFIIDQPFVLETEFLQQGSLTRNNENIAICMLAAN